jgi:monoamine oxidase
MKGTLIAVLVGTSMGAAAAARAQTPDPSAPTYTRDVAPILYKHCTVCHRPGEVAPMSLLTYAEARPYTRAIAAQVSRGAMPPWHADPAYGAFLNDRRLTDREKDIIVRWVNAGAPEGTTADMPPRPVYADGWTIGRPDAVFELPEDYPVPARGTVDYKYFEIPTSFAEDRWIQAYEVKPGAPSVVHHVLVFARAPKSGRPAGSPPQGQPPSGERRQGPFTFAPGMEEPAEVRAAAARQETPNDRPEPKGERGAYIGTFAPGQSLRVFQPGSAMRLPAGAGPSSRMGQLRDVAYNTEYGADTTDQSALNLVYLLAYQPRGSDFELFGESDERYHLIGGNESLPRAIAASLPSNSIKLNTSLLRIARNADGTFTLRFGASGGTLTVTADRVILALPFSVLRNLDYDDAGFSPLKRAAIEQLGYGTNTKLNLQFNRRTWNDRGPWGISTGGSYADTGYQTTWDVTRAQKGRTGILVNYTGGSIGASFTGDRRDPIVVNGYANAFLAQIEPVFPGLTAEWNGRATLDTPATNPFLLGSYSFWKVGQYTQFAGVEKEASGQCYFAGEHCSTDFQGFMEGGAVEGARAAAEVIASL